MFPARIEIVPTAGVVDSVREQLPAGTTVTVTCLPHHGVERTMRASLQLAALGYHMVPHLAARSLESRAQLAAVIRDCLDAGIGEIFAVGGDAKQAAGPYGSSLPLIEDIAEQSGGNMRVGVAGYPEGHPAINDEILLGSLLAKQKLAGYVVTQMCFSAPAVGGYISRLRAEGVDLPVFAGVAGAVPRAKLVSLAAKIGVGTSLKFLGRQAPVARHLFARDTYNPEGLVAELTALSPGVEGIHLYSFNNLTL